MTVLPMATQSAAAQAASPQIVNLSCNGTKTWQVDKPPGNGTDSDKRGIIINLTDGTVAGGFGFVAHITGGTNDTIIEFSGTGLISLYGEPAGTMSVWGGIDLVNRAGTVFTTSELGTDPKTKLTVNDAYNYTCKVTNRQF